MSESASARKARGQEERRKAQSQRIVEVALRLLSAEGFDALTVGRVADELGYTVGALYRYFPSKDALFVAMQGEVLSDACERLQAARRTVDLFAASRSLSPRVLALTRVCATAITQRRFAVEKPAFFGVLSVSLYDSRELVSTEVGRRAVEPMLALNAQFAAPLAEAAHEKALDPGDANLRAFAFWSAHHTPLAMKKFERLGVAGLSTEAIADEIVCSLLRGWGADARELGLALDRAKQAL